jgi:threonylcarbamoyladenosine tRNA methylthiotransferase MtaB
MFFPALLSGPGKKDNLDFPGGLFRYVKVHANKMEVKVNRVNYKKMQDTPAVAFYTLGCKLNFAETSTIERLFAEKGFRKVEFGSPASVYVINTCSVTAAAEKKCRNVISRAVRSSPGAFIAVVGCYSQLKSDIIARIPGVDLVLGSREKFKIFDFAGDFRKTSEPAIHSCEISGEREFSPSYSISGRTRSFLKIQDGCDYFCSYCTIPLARGRSRSATIEDILMQAEKIAENGVREVVLTGVNIGDFGRTGSGSLYELLCRLRETGGIERFRLSSIEPDLLSDEIIDLIAEDDKFAPHFHIPLQSGCDRILKEMNRKYPRYLFSDRVDRIRRQMPFAGIGADVIIGFPGETDRDFEETRTFLDDADLAFLHVFTYSDRSNTRSHSLPDKVSPEIKEYRSRVLHQIADVKRMRFLKMCSGQVHPVLFEAVNKKGRMYGFTGNYIRVEAAGEERHINRIVRVRLLAPGEDGIMKGVVEGE